MPVYIPSKLFCSPVMSLNRTSWPSGFQKWDERISPYILSESIDNAVFLEMITKEYDLDNVVALEKIPEPEEL